MGLCPMHEHHVQIICFEIISNESNRIFKIPLTVGKANVQQNTEKDEKTKDT